MWGALALAGSASASNIALISLGATATASNQLSFNGVNYFATNAIDGSLATEWVAPGLTGAPTPPTTVEPWLLINLGQLYTVDSVTVDGIGNPGLNTSFDIFVGTLAALTNIANGGAPGAGATLVLQVVNQADGSSWSLSGSVLTSSQIQYVLYEAVNVTIPSSNCANSSCYPGSAVFSGQTPVSGQEDAFTTEILVDAVPEPTTMGLVRYSPYWRWVSPDVGFSSIASVGRIP